MKNFTLCSLLLTLLLGACSSAVPLEPGLPESYAAAYRELEDGNYTQSASDFSDIETRFPVSEWAADALIMSAYSYYMEQDFAGAILALDRFMRFHPGHPSVDYVMYLRGMCLYRQVSDVRREPGMSVQALQTFAGLVQRFPSSEYAQNAMNKIVILKNYIAGKQLYSARRDMKKQNWIAAIGKLQSIVADASETQMTPEALYRLYECYTAISLPEQAAGYAQMLKTNFPDSDWTKKV
jgi:outer membrane protein assembly factor BamD